MIANAWAAFDGDTRVACHPTRGSFWLVVDGWLVVRFKKGDVAGFSRNYPTTAALNFLDPQQPLPAIDVVHRVQVQYVLNSDATDIADIVVVCRNGPGIAWLYSLLAPAVPVALPVAPDPGPRTPLDRLLHPREVGDDRTAEGARAQESPARRE
jgi:hypothetical protein